MPKNRIGFATDFNLTNSKVGIGTTNPRATLDVVGVLKGDFNISGVTTLTSYAGFIPQKQNIYFDTTVGIKTVGVGTFVQSYETQTGNLELEGEFNSLSEDIIVDEGKIFEITTTNITGITTLGTQSYDYDTSTVSLGTLESISIGAHLSVPNGGITLRPQDPIEGTVRFNDDLNTLEFYNGVEWRQFTVTGASGRGVFGGGGPGTSIIDYINIPSTGNAINFGNLTEIIRHASGFSSEIRGVIYFGYGPVVGISNIINYITIASEGNSIDFGDLNSNNRYVGGSCSSSTRGIIGGGQAGPATSNVIQYITIQTLGDSLDFGDLTSSKRCVTSCSNSTRGIFGGGEGAPVTITSVIEVVTIASKGDAIVFGDLTQKKGRSAGCSNSTRGVFAGGYIIPANVNINTIEYITISSNGNSSYFGDLSFAGGYMKGTSSSIHGVFVGGSGPMNNISFVTISTTGNAQDFGDLTVGRYDVGALSDSHGGLGGF